MTSESFSLPDTSTVAGTVAGINRLGEDFEAIHYVHALDAEGVLTSRAPSVELDAQLGRATRWRRCP